jgi:hypothetical protein
MVNSSACYEESPGQIPDGEFYILLGAVERKFCNFSLVCTSENYGSADTQLWSNITLKRGIFKIKTCELEICRCAVAERYFF